MVLSDDYTPKYAVAEGRLIPLSLAAVRGGYRGFFPPPSGNSRWDLSRIREKVAYLPPRAAGRGRDPGSGPRRTARCSGSRGSKSKRSPTAHGTGATLGEFLPLELVRWGIAPFPEPDRVVVGSAERP